MFTDIHTHAFHPKIARHAVEHLNEAYQLDCVGEGTIADLLLREKRSGIGRCVVLCAATTPGQVVPANDYAVTLQRDHPEVTAFGTLHPGYEAWESQLERLKAAGIRGLKLHPDFQHFWLNDPRLLPMFEAAQDDFIFLFHIGDNVPPEKNPSCPYKLAALLDRFPRLRCIAEIKQDMEQARPMDRLLCGDVGYGKTEVALRAVMKCVLDGKQAAILVPTTVLAQQHYATAVSRFRNFPVVGTRMAACLPSRMHFITARRATSVLP